MRNRFEVRIQKELLAQSHEEVWTEYRSGISSHLFGSSRSMCNAEKVGPETGNSDCVDESSDGSSNCSSGSRDQKKTKIKILKPVVMAH